MRSGLRRTAGRRRTAILTATLALVVPGSAQAAVAGDPDNSFSGDGLLSTSFNSATSLFINDVAADGDGRLIVVGSASSDLRVARLNPDGSFDATFGGDGDVALDAGTPNDIPVSVAVDPANGNILVLGTIQVASEAHLFIARFLPGGGLDPAFDGPTGTNGNGLVIYNFGDNEGAGDIMAAGTEIAFTANLSNGTARLVRLESTGELDTDFNTNGFRDFQWAPATQSFATGLAQQGDGKLVVSGIINGLGPYGVARFTTTGQLDATFNGSGTIPGVARPALPADHSDADVLDVAVDSNGITVAGTVSPDAGGLGRQAMISRVTTSGDLDTGFDSDGYGVLPIGGSNDEGFMGLAPLGGGSVLAGGFSGAAGANRHLFARFTGAGAVDASFSGDGFVERNPDGTSSQGTSLAYSPGGVAYIGGSGTSFNIAISAICAEVPPACPSAIDPTQPPAGQTGQAGQTGRRAAALKKCKKIKNRAKRKKCKKRAAKLPV